MSSAKASSMRLPSATYSPGTGAHTSVERGPPLSGKLTPPSDRPPADCRQSPTALQHAFPTRSAYSTSAAAPSIWIAPEDRDSGTCESEQRQAGKDCD